MADVLSKSSRHYNMTQIRSKDTKPEDVVRKYLFSRGLRYRKNDARYAGKPDIVLPKYRAVVFINGCFWHMHEGCKCFKMPSTNSDYWIPKLTKNKARDIMNCSELEKMGWRVFVVWECQLGSRNRMCTLEGLYNAIIRYEV